MVDTYKDPKQAFEALEKECYKPKTSTSRTTHKVEKGVAIAVGGAALGAGGAALGVVLAPAGAALAAAFALPSLAALTHMSAAALAATGSAVSSIGGSAGSAAYSGLKDRKDMPCTPGNVPALDRTTIKSLLRKDNGGTPLTLKQVAGDRAGTKGNVYVKDLLEAIVAHYQLAMRNWNDPPFRPGMQSPSPHSCQEAEDLYRKFVEVDYHLSKMCAYAEKLKEVADAYVTFCKRNAFTLEGYFDDCKRRVNLVLEQRDDWHHKHCNVMDHCYRTSKFSRMGVTKETNPNRA